jgi:hypothetical protein
MLYFGSDHGLITLKRDATLHPARNMDIGYQQLPESPELVDRLALELQRSTDHDDRHFQQAPITCVTLCSLPGPAPRLADQLAEQTGMAVHELRVEDIVDVDPAVDRTQFPRCVLAIGAALRSDPAQLQARACSRCRKISYLPGGIHLQFLDLSCQGIATPP